MQKKCFKEYKVSSSAERFAQFNVKIQKPQCKTNKFAEGSKVHYQDGSWIIQFIIHSFRTIDLAYAYGFIFGNENYFRIGKTWNVLILVGGKLCILHLLHLE